MHATSTVQAADSPVATSAPPRSDSKTFARAIADIKAGFSARELWGHLGWQDIKQRYRRSVIGPFWITISQAVIALGLGLLYSQLFHSPIEVFLPYLSTGFILWGFISGCLAEGMETFIANEGMIKQLPAPLSVYMLRTVWRQTLLLAHNMIVYVVILVIFFSALDGPYSLGSPDGLCHNGLYCHPGLSWNILLAIPGFLLLALNAAWVTLLLGIISTRFRDIPQVINSLIQLLFYGTPIVWPVDQLLAAWLAGGCGPMGAADHPAEPAVPLHAGGPGAVARPVVHGGQLDRGRLHHHRRLGARARRDAQLPCPRLLLGVTHGLH